MHIKCINCSRSVRIENAHKGYGPVCAERLGLIELVQKTTIKTRRNVKIRVTIEDDKQTELFEGFEDDSR